jgi:mRNA interferase HigB
LVSFWKEYADAEVPLRVWFTLVSAAHWKDFNELRATIGHVSIVGNDRVVFNIAGNKYRLVVKMEFKLQRVYIRFVGIHKAYDKIDVGKV